MSWIRALIIVCLFSDLAAAQGQVARSPWTSLQPGTPIERSLGPGQNHNFGVTANENSLVQITIEQRGIDVVVTVYSPRGKKLGEYDSPTGADGAEELSFVTDDKGQYRVQVTAFNRESESATGRYEIKLVELRPATDEEIKGSKNQEALKARGIALLSEIDGLIVELRLPQTRIRAQLQAAQLLWEADEKRALKYATDALTSFKELLAGVDPESREYTNQYYAISNLRNEVVQMLVQRQPEMALNFIRSTPPLVDPYGHQRDLAAQEAGLELDIANHLAKNDPKRTLEIARENLKTHYSANLGSTISILSQKNPEMAAELAGEVTNKLLGEKSLKNSQAAQLLMTLLHMSGQSRRNPVAETNGSERRVALLTEQQYRDLFQKALNEAMAYKPTPLVGHSPERDYAWGLLNGLQSLGVEVDTMMAGGAAAIEKRVNEFNAANNPGLNVLHQQSIIVNNPNTPFDEALSTITRAPKENQEQLYIQLANRAANNGDIARAKQIVKDHVTNPYQRQQALANIEQQETYRSIQKGKVEEALRNIANLPNAQERAQLITQIASQIGPGYKRAATLNLLEQVRGLLPPSLQAQDQVQMNALLEIARAFSRYDSKRAFEIVEPLLDQFNELSIAARTLEGFGGEFYEQEELNLQNGNVIANMAGQLSTTVGTLALTNFDRARLAADRLRLPEVRLRAYLEIAQQTIHGGR